MVIMNTIAILTEIVLFLLLIFEKEALIFILPILELHQLVKPNMFILILIFKLRNLIPRLYLLHDGCFRKSRILRVDFFNLVFVFEASKLIDVLVFLQGALLLRHCIACHRV